MTISHFPNILHRIALKSLLYLCLKRGGGKRGNLGAFSYKKAYQKGAFSVNFNP